MHAHTHTHTNTQTLESTHTWSATTITEVSHSTHPDSTYTRKKVSEKSSASQSTPHFKTCSHTYMYDFLDAYRPKYNTKVGIPLTTDVGIDMVNKGQKPACTYIKLKLYNLSHAGLCMCAFYNYVCAHANVILRKIITLCYHQVGLYTTALYR